MSEQKTKRNGIEINSVVGELPRNIDVRFEGFHKLMKYRVRDILLVASLYDYFILEEAGHLSELLFEEYLSLNLTNPPQITRVSTGEDALKLLSNRHFDLVITLPRVGESNPFELGSKIKENFPDLPVILLIFDLREIEGYESLRSRSGIDKIFLWRGNVDILLAIIKYIEDLRNAEEDILGGGVQAVILIEDSIAFYSSYMPIIYRELMFQTQSLIADEIKLIHKMLRIRARPKILMADNFEDALELYERYKDNLLGIISDIRFQKENEINDKAGVLFALEIRKLDPEIPILLQSSNLEYFKVADDLGAGFIYKKSPTLLEELRQYIKQNFGFGDFIFRLKDGTVVGRVANLYEMEKVLSEIPDESIEYHASRNHFSNWLKARTEFELAVHLRPVKISDFENIDGLRQYLINTFRQYRHLSQKGVIMEFSRKQFDIHSEFVRIGSGSMGGKARGLAFIRNMLERFSISDHFKDVEVIIPPTAVIGTDIFDEFLDRNNLRKLALTETDEKLILERFLEAKLPESIYGDIASLLQVIKYPLAVRSSSLLEDSHFQPFAGIYQTYMFPNNHQDLSVRLDQLCDAIKIIYASTFSNTAKSYISATNNRIEEEKMAIILQQIVGAQHGDRFYPSISGIARSYNYYPVRQMKPEDGIAFIALGFGRIVVEGGEVLRFSPKHPQFIPQFSTVAETLANSQKYFYALDMSQPFQYPSPDLNENMIQCDLKTAEQDGELKLIGSTYTAENNAIYDGISRQGVRVVTFAHILKSELFPLAKIIETLLSVGTRGMNIPVEMEFAVNLSPPPGKKKQFGVLQIRPLIQNISQEVITIDEKTDRPFICYSDNVLGNGRFTDIKDIIYLKPDKFDPARTREIASEISELNASLQKKNKPYLLIGFGRWGTADPWLGIPVNWKQISMSRIIIETSLKNFDIDPSHGTHFFHNLTTLGIGYFTVNPRFNNGKINWDWILNQDAQQETEHVALISLKKPLEVLIDGRSGKGLILL